MTEKYESPLKSVELNVYYVLESKEVICLDSETFWCVKDQLFAEWMGWND